MQIFIPVIKPIFSLQAKSHSFLKNFDKWIKKLLFWFLHNTKDNFYFDKIYIHGLDIDIYELIEIIQENEHVIDSLKSEKCKYVILGVSNINKIKLLLFDRQILVQVPRNYNNKLFAGLNIIVVPWLEGAISIEGESV